MLYVIILIGFVIIILLWKIFREVRRSPYLEASYDHGETKRYCCQTCRFWQPSELLPHDSKDWGECLRSPEAWLLQHVVVRLDKLTNRDTCEYGYFNKSFTCGMYKPIIREHR